MSSEWICLFWLWCFCYSCVLQKASAFGHTHECFPPPNMQQVQRSLVFRKSIFFSVFKDIDHTKLRFSQISAWGINLPRLREQTTSRCLFIIQSYYRKSKSSGSLRKKYKVCPNLHFVHAKIIIKTCIKKYFSFQFIYVFIFF